MSPVDHMGTYYSAPQCRMTAAYGSSAPCVLFSGHVGLHEDVTGRQWTNSTGLIARLIQEANADRESTMGVSPEPKEER